MITKEMKVSLLHLRFKSSQYIIFYSMWGRIRPVGSQQREAKEEKF